jgi:hypothetical protein
MIPLELYPKNPINHPITNRAAMIYNKFPMGFKLFKKYYQTLLNASYLNALPNSFLFFCSCSANFFRD